MKRLYLKIEVSLFDVSFRIITKYNIKNDILIVIFIQNKTNKNFWENILWDSTLEKKINNRIYKISDDIENNDYKIY